MKFHANSKSITKVEVNYTGVTNNFTVTTNTFESSYAQRQSINISMCDRIWSTENGSTSTGDFTSKFCRYPSCGSHSSDEILWLCLMQRLLLSRHMGKICRITIMRPSALWVSSRISVSLISCRGKKTSVISPTAASCGKKGLQHCRKCTIWNVFNYKQRNNKYRKGFIHRTPGSHTKQIMNQIQNENKS